MILKNLSSYIQEQGRVSENTLLKKFRLSPNGLAPMIQVLINRGHIQKTVDISGGKVNASTFYSWHTATLIPMTTLFY